MACLEQGHWGTSCRMEDDMETGDLSRFITFGHRILVVGA